MAQKIEISDELYVAAEKLAKEYNCAVSSVVEKWANVGKIANENPDLSSSRDLNKVNNKKGK